jgi:hypothetical protein
MLKLYAMPSNRPVYVNIHLVRYIEAMPSAGAALYFGEDDALEVRETPDEIFALISPPPVPA